MASIRAWSRAGAAWLGTVARPAWARASPAWLGAAIVGGAVFGGNGLMPRDLMRIAQGAPRVMVGLAIGWTVLLLPAVRAAAAGPGRALLRSLPGARALEAAAVIAMAMAVHVPWGAMAWAAGGARAVWTWPAIVAASLLVVAAAARVSRRPRAPRWRSAWRALAGVHVRALARRRGGSLAFALGLALLAGALASALVASARTDAGGEASLVAACAAAAAAVALAAIATTIVDDRAATAPWVGAAAVAPAARRIALVIVLAGAGAAVGAIAGAAAAVIGAWDAGAAAARIGAAVACGAGVGAAMTAAAERGGRVPHPGGLMAAIAALIMLSSVIALGMMGARGIVVVVGVGAAVAAGGRPR